MRFFFTFFIVLFLSKICFSQPFAWKVPLSPSKSVLEMWKFRSLRLNQMALVHSIRPDFIIKNGLNIPDKMRESAVLSCSLISPKLSATLYPCGFLLNVDPKSIVAAHYADIATHYSSVLQRMTSDEVKKYLESLFFEFGVMEPSRLLEIMGPEYITDHNEVYVAGGGGVSIAAAFYNGESLSQETELYRHFLVMAQHFNVPVMDIGSDTDWRQFSNPGAMPYNNFLLSQLPQ